MSPTVFRRAELTPEEVRAGDSDEFIIRLVAGDGYTDGPSRLIVDFSGRLGSSCPNRLVNEASGYVETYVSNPDVTWIQCIWDMQKGIVVDAENPASREGGRVLVVDLSAGIRPGDTVEIYWGETTRGFGPGAKATTVVPKPDYRDSICVRYFQGHDSGLPDYACSYEGYERPQPDAEVELTYAVKPRELRRLRLIRKWDKALLIPHDRFWNVAETASADALVEADAPDVKNEQGVFEFPNPHVLVKSRSAPVIDSPSMDDVFEGMNLYWGDLHSHSHHSTDCYRTVRMQMTPDELMRFARDRAGLDFHAVTDHHTPAAGPSHVLGAERWERLLDDVRRHNAPGAFIVFPGFELSCPRGDTVFVFNEEPDYTAVDQDWRDIRDAWRALEGRDYMSIPHFHTAGGRLPEGTWWANPKPEREPVLEILSDHGSYEREDALESGRADCKRFRYDRCGVHFLKEGYRYGFAGHSDDHKGHVGVNALTAVFAESLDRDSIFEAYRCRRIYATSNARIGLIFTGNGELMGSVIPNAARKTLHIDVVAESALKKLEVFRNGELYKRFAPTGPMFKTDLTVEEDAPDNWYVRVTQIDNQIAVTSPIWFC